MSRVPRMADKKGLYKIPFRGPKNLWQGETEGSLLCWDNGSEDTTWIDNHEWEGGLKISGYSRGRSSVRLVLTAHNGRKYEMFMTDSIKMLKEAEKIIFGFVYGKWTYVKRGANYGLVWLSDA